MASSAVPWRVRAEHGQERALYWAPVAYVIACEHDETTCRRQNGSEGAGERARVFVPIHDGDVLRVRSRAAAKVERGLAFGAVPEASIISWLPARPEEDPTVLAVPFAIPARFAVFRSSASFDVFRVRRRVALHAARRTRDALLHGGSALPGSPDDRPQIGREASDRAPRTPEQGDSGGATTTANPRESWGRLARELAALARAALFPEHILRRVYGSPRALELYGTSEPLREPFYQRVRSRTINIAAGTSVPLSSTGVFAFRARARVGEDVHLSVSRGEVLVRKERFLGADGPSAAGGAWTSIRMFREVGADVRLAADGGDVHVEYAEYDVRDPLLEALGLRADLAEIHSSAESASMEPATADASLWARALQGDLQAHQMLSRQLRRESLQPSAATAALLLALTAPTTSLRDQLTARAAAESLDPVLLLRLLDRYWNIGAALPPSACLSLRNSLESSAGTPTDDSRAAQALMSLLCDGDLAVALRDLATLSREVPEDAYYGALAREALRRFVRFQPLASGQGLELELPVAATEGALCPRSGFAGFRWRVLGPGHHRAHVSRGVRDGLRIRVAARDTTGEDLIPWQGHVRVNGAPLAVHGATGLVTSVDTAPGPVTLEIPMGAPKLLVRIPYADAYPCAALRDVVVTEPLGAGATFRLLPDGDPGEAPARPRGLARLAIDWRSTATDARWRSHHVSASTETVKVELGPRFRQGTVQLSLPPGTTQVTVRPAAESSADSIHLRLATTRPAEDVAIAVPESAREDVARERPPAASTEESLLEDVRVTSAMLRRAPDHDGARRRRADALWALGARRASRIDFSGISDLPPGAGVMRSVAGTESDASRVVPGNWLARVPPLTVADGNRLREARALIRRGQRDTALALLEDAPSGSADQLLRASILDDLGRSAEAAGILASLQHPATLHRAGELFLRAAAEQLGPSASATRRLEGEEHLLRALACATEARNRGEATDRLLQRIYRLVRWQIPAASLASAGTRLVERDTRAEETSRWGRIRRALLGAPGDAVLLSEGQWLAMHWRAAAPVTTTLAVGCLAMDTLLPCTPEVFLDGAPVRDPELRLQAGSRHLEVRPPAAAIAWVQLEGGAVPAPVTRRLYYEVAPESPLQFAAVGAAVLRLSLADPADGVEPAGATPLQVFVDGAPVSLAELDPGRFEVALPPSPDAPRVRQVEVRSAGRTLVRPELAVLGSVPVPEPLLVAVDPIARDLPPLDGIVSHFDADSAVPAGPFSLRLSAKTAFREVRDLDVFAEGTPYFELQPELLYRSEDSALRVASFGRLRTRDGPLSAGGGAQLALSSDGFRPGIFVSAEAMLQDLDRLRVGLEGNAALYFPVLRESFVHLDTSLGATLFHATTPRSRQQGIDPDVFTRFSRDHPISGTAAIRLSSRPFLDLFWRAQLSARSNADFESLDRVGAALQVDWLPGAGWAPWLTFGYDASYRFADAFRPQAIGRHILFSRAHFWRWFWADGRIGLSGELEWVLDRQEFAGFLALEYLFSPQRGVHDLSRQQSLYRERLEEGAILSDVLRRPVGLIRPFAQGE